MKFPLIILLCTLLSSGCFPSTQESTEPSSETSDQANYEDLISELKQILKDPEANLNNPRTFQICDQLAMMDPAALSPIIELLDEPDTTPETKIFILQAVNINMTEAYLPIIKTLLDSENQTTRSCATTLLGPINASEAVDLLLALKQDENPGISFAAWSGLAQHELKPYRNDFVQYYSNENASTAQRSEIMRIMVTNTKPEDIPTLSNAVTSKEIESGIRIAITGILAEMGSLGNIQALQKSIDLEAADHYKVLAESAIARIKERYKA